MGIYNQKEIRMTSQKSEMTSHKFGVSSHKSEMTSSNNPILRFQLSIVVGSLATVTEKVENKILEKQKSKLKNLR